MGSESESSDPQKKQLPLPSPPPHLHVPKRLVEAVNHARPLCIFHQMRRGCKKGAKCPQRHTGASNNDANLPHMSFERDKDGQVKCTLRPPLNESWNCIFKEKDVPRRVLKGSIKISSGEEDLRMYQLGYMSGPSPKAKEAMSSGGIQRWTWRKNEQAWKHTWQGVTGRVNLECFFIHGSTVENATQAILDGALKPTTFETAKDPICGVPGVYFSELPSLDEEDIIRAWHQNKSSGYNRGAVIICKLVGAPLNNDKTGQNTVIEEGMISTKIGSKGVLQIAAHENCIRYVAAVFNEDLLNSYLGKVMERLRGYSPSMHESLKAVKAFLESGTKDKNEPMIALQNVLVNSASTKPAKPVPLPPPPPPPVHWCGVPAYIHSTLFPWQWQEWSWAKSPPPPQPPPRISPPPQPTEPPPHDAAESGSSKSYRSGSSVTIWPGPDRSRHTEHQEPEDTQEHTRHKATQSKWAPRRQSTQEPEDTQKAQTQTPQKRHTPPGPAH